jgi:hypothetical protein
LIGTIDVCLEFPSETNILYLSEELDNDIVICISSIQKNLLGSNAFNWMGCGPNPLAAPAPALFTVCPVMRGQKIAMFLLCKLRHWCLEQILFDGQVTLKPRRLQIGW